MNQIENSPILIWLSIKWPYSQGPPEELFQAPDSKYEIQLE